MKFIKYLKKNKEKIMRKILILSAIMVLIAGMSCLGQSRNVQCTFTWTATGDDSLSGQASKYSIKYSTTSLTEANWGSATEILESTTKVPKPSGQPETLIVTLTLTQGNTYYFAIKAADEVPNWSPISNVVSRFISDIFPPAMIINFKLQ